MHLVTGLCLILMSLAPSPAYGYLGPGLGMGALGLLLGLGSTVLLALFGILWYPIKTFWRSLRK